MKQNVEHGERFLYCVRRFQDVLRDYEGVTMGAYCLQFGAHPSKKFWVTLYFKRASAKKAHLESRRLFRWSSEKTRQGTYIHNVEDTTNSTTLFETWSEIIRGERL